jgi:integrase
MITLFLYTGMRRGELCGLEWKDIDFNNGLIDINKSSLYLADKGVFQDDTKNFSSKRVIKVPDQALCLLKDYKQTQGSEKLKLGSKWDEHGKIFTQWNGKPIHPDSVTGWFHDFIDRNRLPYISVHSLRHTNATLLIASGVDLRTVSKRLGHANMTTTGNIYTHAIQSADERAAEALGDILSPGSNKQEKKA